MFGQSEEEKKKEAEKLKEEQAKLEEEAAKEMAPGAAKEPEKTEKKEPGLAGLKNFASGPAGTGADEPGKTKDDKKKQDEKPKEEDAGKKEKAPKEEKAAEKPEEKPSPSPEKEPAPAKEPAEMPARPEKKTDPEVLKLKKQLEQQRGSIRAAELDREEAMKKSEELAGLVEEISGEANGAKAAQPVQQVQPVQPAAPSLEPKIKELEEKMSSQVKELKEALEASTAKKDEEKKGEAEVAETMKKMFDKRLKELGEKLDESKAAPAAKEAGAPGQAGEVSGGLMAMGGGVELEKEMDKLKKSMKDIATLLDAFREEAENRFMAIDRELETVETIPNLEDKMKQFERKLGPENVDKLRMLISGADDLKENVIPMIVKRVVEERIEPHSKKVKDTADSLQRASDKINSISTDIVTVNRDIKALYRFDDRISKLEEGLSGVSKLIAELRTLVRDLDKEQRRTTEAQIKEALPKVVEAESINTRKEFAGRFAFIDDKLQSVENMIAESHKEISELAALKGEMGSLEDGLEKVNDEKEKILNRLDALKSRDMDMLDKIEDLQTPKEIITELDNKTKDVLDIREFFTRRANGLEERINTLDERAVPAKKMHDKVASLVNDLKGVHESQRKLEQRIDSEKKEFQLIIKHHAEEKRKLEEKLQEQRARISTLLREFK